MKQLFLAVFFVFLFIGCQQEKFKEVNQAASLNSKMTQAHQVSKNSMGDKKLPEGHPKIEKSSILVKKGEIKKVAGGYTVEELFNRGKNLKNKIISVRGKVVKFNPNIMGINWIHLKDGSGDQGTNDITVTSKTSVAIGQIITAKGKLIYDKDLGSGYFFKALIEKAEIQ